MINYDYISYCTGCLACLYMGEHDARVQSSFMILAKNIK